MGLEGALKAPNTVSRPEAWPPASPPAMLVELVEKVNTQEVLLRAAEAGSQHPEPIISPPLYGRWHALQEQLDAASVLGVKEVVFLGHPDGGLEDTPAFRGELVRLIRKHRPDVVVTADPYRRYLWHRDHRITGIVTLDAVFPYARDRLSYPEHMAEGLEPHAVREVYLWASEEPNLYIDITETFETKMAALGCHVSQVGHFMEAVRQRMEERAVKTGEGNGVPLAEAFHRVEMPRWQAR